MKYLKIKLKTLDSNEGSIIITPEPIKTLTEDEMRKDLRRLLQKYDCPTDLSFEDSQKILKGTAGIIYAEIE